MIVIDIGHSPFDQGAVAQKDGFVMSEFMYNSAVAQMLQPMLRESYGIPAVIENRYKMGLTTHARSINLNHAHAKAVVSLHCNSFSDATANGYEVLYWHDSGKAKRLAGRIAAAIGSLTFSSSARAQEGSKAIKGKRERGSAFLRATAAPAVIVEPFFLSNDLGFASWVHPAAVREYALALAEAINDYVVELEVM